MADGIGDRVRVVGGEHLGKTGVIDDLLDDGNYLVRLDGGDAVTINPPDVDDAQAILLEDHVTVHEGSYAGNHGVVVGFALGRVVVGLDGRGPDDEAVLIPASHLGGYDGDDDVRFGADHHGKTSTVPVKARDVRRDAMVALMNDLLAVRTENALALSVRLDAKPEDGDSGDGRHAYRLRVTSAYGNLIQEEIEAALEVLGRHQDIPGPAQALMCEISNNGLEVA